MKKDTKKTPKTPDLKSQVLALEDIRDDLREMLLRVATILAKEPRVIEPVKTLKSTVRAPQARFKLTDTGYVQIK